VQRYPLTERARGFLIARGLERGDEEDERDDGEEERELGNPLLGEGVS
jgi:hypothetical protein